MNFFIILLLFALIQTKKRIIVKKQNISYEYIENKIL